VVTLKEEFVSAFGGSEWESKERESENCEKGERGGLFKRV